jgi:hypothetical protein
MPGGSIIRLRGSTGWTGGWQPNTSWACNLTLATQ